MKLENLVFQGGGVKGAAYAGAIEVLHDRGLLGDVRRVAGTSAGAITAAILAVGAGSEGLGAAVKDTKFGTFLDGHWSIVGDAARLVSHFGLYPGDHFSDLMKSLIAHYAGERDLTLGGLRERALAHPGQFFDLFVIASNVTRQSAEVLCADTHPDMPVWLAVRTSMSIPLLFEAVQVRGEAFVDGGLAWNYPIDLFDHAAPQVAQPGHGHPRIPETLGFAVVPRTDLGGRPVPPPHVTNTLKTFLTALGSFMYETSNRAHFHPEDAFRTVRIDDLGVATADFNAPPATIASLVHSGRKATIAYLDRVAAADDPVIDE